jgi:hypothetical protein
VLLVPDPVWCHHVDLLSERIGESLVQIEAALRSRVVDGTPDLGAVRAGIDLAEPESTNTRTPVPGSEASSASAFADSSGAVTPMPWPIAAKPRMSPTRFDPLANTTGNESSTR